LAVLTGCFIFVSKYNAKMNETTNTNEVHIVPSGKLVYIAEISQHDYEHWGKHIANGNVIDVFDKETQEKIFAYNENGVINTIKHLNKHLPKAHKTSKRKHEKHAFLVCDEAFAKQIVINIANFYAVNSDNVMIFNVFRHYQPAYKKYCS
jgi:hypothetical protein